MTMKMYNNNEKIYFKSHMRKIKEYYELNNMLLFFFLKA